jgi:hypothetical protein
MPYMNKRNRFVAAAKQYAEANNIDISAFTKSDLLTVAQSINMKGIPTWVLKDYRSAVSKGAYDLTSLINPVTV